MARWVICGGRVGVEREGAWAVLEKLLEIGLIRPDDALGEGDAPGYDRIGGAWGRHRRLTCRKFKIDPDLDGHRDDAPKKRNRRMFEEQDPTHCLGFPGGPGTRDMMTICHKAGRIVFDVEFDTRRRRFQVWQWVLRVPGKTPTAGASGLITEGSY